jgi:hypothetical protein
MLIKIMKKKIGILLYLYDINLWNEFANLLIPIQDKIVLYIGLNISQKNNTLFLNNLTNNFDTKISFYKNYGVDVYPFIDQLCNLLTEDYFIKIHGKKSMLGNNKQINWRVLLLYSFFGSKNIFDHNFDLIQEPSIGSVGNKNLLFGEWENTNSTKIKYLCNILNIEYKNITNLSFFAGNMFMSKTDLFKQYFQNHDKILFNLLSQEKGKVQDYSDGTFCHSLERLFGYIISYSNLNFGFSNSFFESIKILNNAAPNKHFNMVTLYNNDCFLQEDINMYGKILDHEINKYIVIKWLHLNMPKVCKYEYIDSCTILNTKYKNEY